MRRQIGERRPPSPVQREAHPTGADTSGDRLIMIRPQVPEEVSDVHVRRSREGELPVQNAADAAVLREDVPGIVVAVHELMLGV